MFVCNIARVGVALGVRPMCSVCCLCVSAMCQVWDYTAGTVQRPLADPYAVLEDRRGVGIQLLQLAEDMEKLERESKLAYPWKIADERLSSTQVRGQGRGRDHVALRSSQELWTVRLLAGSHMRVSRQGNGELSYVGCWNQAPVPCLAC